MELCLKGREMAENFPPPNWLDISESCSWPLIETAVYLIPIYLNGLYVWDKGMKWCVQTLLISEISERCGSWDWLMSFKYTNEGYAQCKNYDVNQLWNHVRPAGIWVFQVLRSCPADRVKLSTPGAQGSPWNQVVRVEILEIQEMHVNLVVEPKNKWNLFGAESSFSRQNYDRKFLTLPGANSAVGQRPRYQFGKLFPRRNPLYAPTRLLGEVAPGAGSRNAWRLPRRKEDRGCCAEAHLSNIRHHQSAKKNNRILWSP